MNNKKFIIQIIVIVAAFGAAGLILYNGFFKGNGQPPAQAGASSQAAVAGPQDILPNGNSLDFSVLHSNNFQFDQVDYPQLDANNDVGIPVNNLITPSGSTGQ